MIQILSHTPAWVFVLLIALIVLGLMQTTTRSVRKIPALILPAGMIVLSLAGINSSFGLRPVPVVSWVVAVVFAAFVGYAIFRDKRVTYDATEGKFHVPGSWVPLAVIMAIFFAKYVYAAMYAMQSDLISTPVFIVSLSAVYGLLSGYFAAKALNLIRQMQKI